ncbi:uncharacterized protein MONBRDRAFT_33606 [Monosiga brevicollis MX1]|uniref:Uncharacterized protein n=1 Tax=Monosiga brevicollis TaxID=81824 RepID=A9V6D3_MONBE|nr:uncharacterized protein MONBRDRAFT_33606 [Monosiga brevicollis MX1]EDQ87044.1 predicted protein [Monosiga brevicollis MX1]|eukprot:XP_001748283.1 hypothetical protein [Monosiga brevicollis MX1]
MAAQVVARCSMAAVSARGLGWMAARNSSLRAVAVAAQRLQQHSAAPLMDARRYKGTNNTHGSNPAGLSNEKIRQLRGPVDDQAQDQAMRELASQILQASRDILGPSLSKAKAEQDAAINPMDELVKANKFDEALALLKRQEAEPLSVAYFYESCVEKIMGDYWAQIHNITEAMMTQLQGREPSDEQAVQLSTNLQAVSSPLPTLQSLFKQLPLRPVEAISCYSTACFNVGAEEGVATLKELLASGDITRDMAVSLATSAVDGRVQSESQFLEALEAHGALNDSQGSDDGVPASFEQRLQSASDHVNTIIQFVLDTDNEAAAVPPPALFAGLMAVTATYCPGEDGVRRLINIVRDQFSKGWPVSPDQLHLLLAAGSQMQQPAILDSIIDETIAVLETENRILLDEPADGAVLYFDMARHHSDSRQSAMYLGRSRKILETLHGQGVVDASTITDLFDAFIEANADDADRIFVAAKDLGLAQQLVDSVVRLYRNSRFTPSYDLIRVLLNVSRSSKQLESWLTMLDVGASVGFAAQEPELRRAAQTFKHQWPSIKQHVAEVSARAQEKMRPTRAHAQRGNANANRQGRNDRRGAQFVKL